ncbi:MAG: hypothetical protein Q4F01_07345 [Staphylococcus rostri]|uniref:hypothetical protein n=1 Tax=Staphylococcus rostri TaxID=522262 RepID=UPI0026E103AA|nr:hypothetical protein [Staphylococcus rostri]MDO5375986.1 hypothetical protein [Staphylococcus rostri]
MTLKILSLSELLKGTKREIKEKIPEIQKILDTFETISITGSESAQEVENFLKNKAIDFDRQSLAKTYLVFSQSKNKGILVGYFTINNKPLVFTKRMLSRCSKTLKKRLYQKGETYLNSDNLIIQGYLIAQLGKNYAPEALATKSLKGSDLLILAYKIISEGSNFFGGSYIWVEYENTDKLRAFYANFGFTEIVEYQSHNNLKTAILKI